MMIQNTLNGIDGRGFWMEVREWWMEVKAEGEVEGSLRPRLRFKG